MRREEFERAVGLPPAIFERLETAAGMQEDLDQIQYGLSAAVRSLGASGPAGRLLTEAVALEKVIAREFAETPELPGRLSDGASLPLDDVCLVLEQMFRFTGVVVIGRITGVRREVIEQLRSAAAFAGKRDGWGGLAGTSGAGVTALVGAFAEGLARRSDGSVGGGFALAAGPFAVDGAR